MTRPLHRSRTMSAAARFGQIPAAKAIAGTRFAAAQTDSGGLPGTTIAG